MTHRLPLFFIAIVISLAGIAQGPYLYFNKITSQDGLSHNQVNCILQDRRGFVWIGTNDGLNRFDGKYFSVFTHRPGDSTSISGNIINDIHEDEKGILWIATADGGMTRYDHKLPPGLQFKQYKHKPSDPNSIPINIINSLVQDAYGYLWLGTSGRSVLRFDKTTGRFEMPVRLGTKTILTLSMGDNDTLWAGREGGGILKVNTKDLGSYADPRYRNLYAKLPHAAVTSIYRDKYNSLWVGSWDEVLYRYDLASHSVQAFKSGDAINSFTNDEARCFAEDINGRLWIGGKSSGLQLFDRNSQSFYNYKHDASKEGTIAGNTINCMFVDRKGMVWIGTNQGISVYNPAQQPFVQTFLPTNTPTVIYDFYTDENDALWIASSTGLYIQKNINEPLIHKRLIHKGESLIISKIFRDIDGSFYLGTNYSLFQYDPVSERLALLPNTEKDTVMSKIIDSRIVSIVRDTIDGAPVLITVPYGHYLTFYDLKKKIWISRADTVRNIVSRYNFKDNLIRKVFRSAKGDVWLAQGKSGLAKWKDGQFRQLEYFTNDPSSSSSISNNHIYDLTEDGIGNLWISTFGGGLNRFDPKDGKFEHISESAHLLEGITIDNSGNIWTISNGHLHKYDPKTRAYSQFILPDIEKSGGVRGAISKDRKGNIYLAGTNYFIRFRPESVRESRLRPVVYITDLRVFDSSFNHMLGEKELRLRYDQNYFTFEFSAPSYFNGAIEYQYMLEGFDDDWIDAGNRNIASYSNLEGGSYIFRVRASTRKGSWSEDSTNLVIRIIPPFWKRWWFYVLLALTIAAIVYGLYRYRINELLKRQAIRNKIAQDLHDSVGSTLSSISVYSQVAKIQQDKGNQGELKDVLQKISTTSTDMISEMNDIVWAINPGNDSMEKIVQRMESFARPLLQVKGISFVFSYEPAVLQLNLPMEKRKNFYLIFKEAVNNVLKYSDCKKLWVKVSQSYNHVTLEVKDDGEGFDAEQMKLLAGKSLSGNGLINMKRRAFEMKGTCTIESEKGKGTTVLLRFPIT